MECVLRAWRQEDAAALADLLSNRRVQDMLRDGIPYPYTMADARRFIQEMLSADPHAVYPFAITADGKLAGSIALYRQSNIHFYTGELGYYLGQPFWGKGLGTAAVGQFCQHIFAHTDILRIFAEPFAHNAASCRILEKNGFLCEGVLRSNAVKNGMVLDMKLYARIKGEACPARL